MQVPTGTLVSSAARGGLARVRVDEPVACARCAAGRGCGAGIFARQRAGEIIDAHVLDDGLEPGAAVDILLDDGGLLKAALLAYGYPLAGALAGVLSGSAFGDSGAAIGALAGISAGLLLSRARIGTAPVPSIRPRP